MLSNSIPNAEREDEIKFLLKYSFNLRPVLGSNTKNSSISVANTTSYLLCNSLAKSEILFAL